MCKPGCHWLGFLAASVTSTTGAHSPCSLCGVKHLPRVPAVGHTTSYPGSCFHLAEASWTSCRELSQKPRLCVSSTCSRPCVVSRRATGLLSCPTPVISPESFTLPPMVLHLSKARVRAETVPLLVYMTYICLPNWMQSSNATEMI